MRKTQLLIALAAVGFAGSASATNGYFAHGYGIKAKGMGGAGIAYAQDAMAAATNPAGMVLVGDRIDFGAEVFNPNREANINGATKYESGKDYFVIPEFGYNRMLKPDLSVGVVVFGNGGMNTEYDPIPQYNVVGKKTGIDLSQLFIAPTVSYKLNSDHAVGASLNMVYQRFKAYGISNFAASSSAGASLSDNGYDDSTGLGIKLGWTGQLSPTVTMGATYQSKTKMSAFDKYKGLFAQGGDFDIPETYGLGIAIKANPKTTVALDVVKIKYSGVQSVSNANRLLLGQGILGTDGGSGFGWKDQTVYKLGIVHEIDQNLTVRAGYNHGASTIPSTEIAFNVLAPATVEDHLTLGATWTLANKAELSGYFMHAFSHEQSGPTALLGGGTSTIKMNQNAVGIAYGWKM